MTLLIYTYAQSSSFPSSPPDRCGCLPRRRCSGPACRLSACSSQRSHLQSSTRHRRHGRSSAARSARQSARPGTSPRRWQASSWSPDGSQGCFGYLQREGKSLNLNNCHLARKLRVLDGKSTGCAPARVCLKLCWYHRGHDFVTQVTTYLCILSEIQRSRLQWSVKMSPRTEKKLFCACQVQ